MKLEKKTPPPPPSEYILILTEQEALDLCHLMSILGGNVPERERTFDPLYWALSKVLPNKGKPACPDEFETAYLKGRMK